MSGLLKLVLILFIFGNGYCGSFQSAIEPPVHLHHDRPRNLDLLVMEIRFTARNSQIMKRIIHMTYSKVFGPDYIGLLIIEFHPYTSTVHITKPSVGYQCLEIKIYCGQQIAYIEEVNDIPNLLSTAQLMTFADALLYRLQIRKASINDHSTLDYEGCNGEKEKISLFDLYAVLGGTMGFYEQWGYLRLPYQLEISHLMRSVYGLTLPAAIKLGDGTEMTFEQRQKLGEIMPFYWGNNKCTFSKLYKALKSQNVFAELNTKANGVKTKVFGNNMLLPHVNIFHNTNANVQS